MYAIMRIIAAPGIKWKVMWETLEEVKVIYCGNILGNKGLKLLLILYDLYYSEVLKIMLKMNNCGYNIKRTYDITTILKDIYFQNHCHVKHLPHVPFCTHRIL